MAALSAGAQKTAPSKHVPSAKRSPRAMAANPLQTARNLGKAYYEQGQYPHAEAEFRKVVASGHALATDYLDFGMAQMQANHLDAALGSLTTAQQMHAGLPADYNLGILYKRELRYPDAEAALGKVAAADSAEPSAWFNLGAVEASQQKYEAALESYKHVLDMGFERGRNFYVVSLFHTFNALVRLKRGEEAQKFLALHQQYKDRVPPISVEVIALEGGKYGAVVVPKAGVVVAVTSPVRFVDVSDGFPFVGSLRDGLQERISPGCGIAVGDYDGDGRQDIFVITPDGHHLFHNDGGSSFRDVTTDVGVQGRSHCAVFTDYDNSGRLSLIVGGSGLTLYRNTGGQRFTDATAAAGLRLPEGESVNSLAVFDADNDGLLDLFVGTAGRSYFFRNNGDGTFTDITSSAGLGGLERVDQALVADFNNDGFLDLLLVGPLTPPRLFLNRGGAKFVDESARSGLGTGDLADVSDLDHDGNFDVVLWSASGPAAFHNRGDATFSRVQLPHFDTPLPGTLVDVDGDGFDDLLLFANGDRKWHLLKNQGGVFHEAPAEMGNKVGHRMFPTWLNSPGDLELIALLNGVPTAVWRREAPKSTWIEVALKGAKSNASGAGAIVEVKAGNFYQKVMSAGAPVRVFTGDLEKVDVVRVTWPNALVQNAIDVPTGKRLEIRETERLASSCPFVYAWDGTQYRFVTDVLGASPLGELNPDGSLMLPNSSEYVRLPGWVKERDGALAFQFTSEMREVDYFDGARLVAVDHAPGEEIYANEIYFSTPLAPKLYRVRDRHAPVAAVDDSGRDVLPLLLRRDKQYVGTFARTRILGIAETHSLTLDLGEAARSPHVALWLTGWVYWPDSNSSRALSAQKTQMVGPSLQVRDAQGRWVTVIDEMGLPSGTDRSMRVDLSGKFLSDDRHVRIVTNLCVYWDEAFVATDEQMAQPIASSSPLRADLHYRGFATPASDPEGVKPDEVEYTRLDVSAPWNAATGRYTRYGDVRPLLNAADDRMVVMAPGDEITVSFGVEALRPVASGMVRQWFLLLDGWAKDNEPNTVTGGTSGPLPYRAMKSYPYKSDAAGHGAYVRDYQTRERRAVIPPLAPLSK